MSKVEVDQITQQSGSTLTVGGGACKTAVVDATTVTLGRSGGSVSLASGATQSGFGRTGTVDWQTTKKTADFTAANGEGYFVDSSSSVITVTLPGSPSAGSIVSVSDYNGSAATNKITVSRNSSNINGNASNYEITKSNSAVTFVYSDATNGWGTVQTSNTTDNRNPFLVATGGTITTSGDYKIHTFTGPGTFTVTNTASVSAENTVSYLVIAGGGSGGTRYGGGGGAGGFREYKGPADSYTASPLNGNPGGTAVTVTAQAYPITVGGGGSGVSCNNTPSTTTLPGNRGNNSIFSTITSTGGGGGIGQDKTAPTSPLSPGGSGGGGSYNPSFGAGNTPSVTPSQGNNGGTGVGGPAYSVGGGGGAGAVGGNGSPGASGAGGAGLATSITGSPVTRGGGGGGGGSVNASIAAGGSGPGGGTAGGPFPGPGTTTNAGTANTGGGSGGAYGYPGNSGNGGSGIVVIRYKYQ